MLVPHAIGSLMFDGVAGRPPTSYSAQPGDGFRVAMRTLDLFRPSVGAFAIGMARTALELATAYALERHTFGKPLKDHQALAHRLADLRAQTEAARLLVHQAARAHDAGTPDPSVAAMAKLLATEVAQAAVDAAVQFHGAVALEQRPSARAPVPGRAGAADLRGRLGDPARDHLPRHVPRRAEPAMTVSRTDVVVTGGAKGIGRATVERFAAAGDRVIALGRDDGGAGDADAVDTVPCDVTDEAAVASAFDEIGAVDVLVNNAGIGESAPLAAHDA